MAAASDWPEAIHHALGELSVRQVAYVPDAGHARLIELCQADPALRAVVLTTEEEGRVQHLSARQAGADARAAGARQLLITHLQPGVDQERSRADATEAFGAPVAVAAIDDHHEVHP